MSDSPPRNLDVSGHRLVPPGNDLIYASYLKGVPGNSIQFLAFPTASKICFMFAPINLGQLLTVSVGGPSSSSPSEKKRNEIFSHTIVLCAIFVLQQPLPWCWWRCSLHRWTDFGSSSMHPILLTQHSKVGLTDQD